MKNQKHPGFIHNNVLNNIHEEKYKKYKDTKIQKVKEAKILHALQQGPNHVS